MRNGRPPSTDRARGVSASRAAQIDAEVVHLDNGVPNFDAFHRRTDDEDAVALAFDLLLSGDDIRRQPLIERKKALQWVLRKAGNGIQYVEHGERDGEKMFASVCKVGLKGIVSKRATSIYKSGPSRTWIKVKNPKSPAATRAKDGTF
jgi:bifunctional non-homologous end joining protein LigD